MSDPWLETTINQCVSAAFAGEWGTEPKPGNALIFRATDIDDEGRIVGGGASRRLPTGKLTAKQLRDGDILLEGSGGGPGKPVGRVAYFEGAAHDAPALCSNFFKTLRPARDRVDPRFLLRKLAWFYKQAPILALQQQTTGIINLKFEEYLASGIEIPQSVREQSKIAQILDTLDNAIESTEGIIAKLKTVKQGLLHDLLTRGIDDNGDLRPPHAEAPHLYRQSPFGRIPKDWSTPTLAQACSLLRDGTHLPPVRVKEGPLLLSVRNMQHGRLLLTDQDTRVSEGFYRQMHKRWEILRGDVLLAIVGATIGKTAMVGDMPKFTLQRSVAVLRGKPDQMLNEFLHIYLGSPEFQASLWRQVNQTAQPGIYLDQLGTIVIRAPLLPEQEEIQLRLQAAQCRIDDESYVLRKLRKQKSGLMDDLLTGRVRVTPLLQEPQAA